MFSSVGFKSSSSLSTVMKSSIKGVFNNSQKVRFSNQVKQSLYKASSTNSSVSDDRFDVHSYKSDRPRVLITGCMGQIGSELSEYLRATYGNSNVVASDVKTPTIEQIKDGPYEFLDVFDAGRLSRIVENYKITWLVHNAAFLSAIAEKNPKDALRLNCDGLHTILEVANHYKLRVLVPSSIAAFGEDTPLELVPDITIQRPNTIYGIGKLYAEVLGEYYHRKHGLDFRSLRYPGIVSYKTLPGGGTTDYSIDMFHYALKGLEYNCYLDRDVALPMMYMPDCIRATHQLMNAPNEQLKQRVYNVTAMSFTPSQLAEAIKKHIPGFKIRYEPDDLRQPIALTWPRALDDHNARRDWKWKHTYDLDKMVTDMINSLGPMLKK